MRGICLVMPPQTTDIPDASNFANDPPAEPGQPDEALQPGLPNQPPQPSQANPVRLGKAQQDQALARLVPQSVEAEMCVLGSMILNASSMDFIVQIIDKDLFLRPAHAILYETLIEMRQQTGSDGKVMPIDLVLLREELQRRGQLEAIGGVEYLVALAEGVPSAANAEYYASIVRDKALLRRLISAGQEIITDAHDSQDDAETVIDRAEQLVFEIAQRQVRSEAVPIGDIMAGTFELLQEQEGQLVTGLSSGYQQLDELTAGFQKSEMIIIAARPSMGKTALLLNLAEFMSVHDNKPIAFFSLEMSKSQLTQRMLASHARFNLRNMRRGMISPEDWTNLQTAAGDLSQTMLLIDDSAELTCMQMRAKARRLKSQYDIQAVMIDYLQLMTYSGRAQSRQEQITEMSRSIKALARELEIPVICAAQLNRGPADRPTHTPRMSDLRESGSIEQDADVVMLLHNEDYYHRGEEGYVPENRTQLIVAKQRNGPTGTVYLQFFQDFTRFEAAAPTYAGQ